MRGHQFESHVDEATRHLTTCGLSWSVTLIKTVPFGRQLLAGGDLRFGKGFAEIVGDAHHFSGGAHLGTENRVDAGKFDQGNTGDFT